MSTSVPRNPQRLFQLFGIVKVQRQRLHLRAKWIFAIQGVRQGDDSVTRIKQAAGDVTPGVTKRSFYYGKLYERLAVNLS
ncbi:MAG TPA: hypothetical protein VH280_05630 [Verrucomicrobiae bacterium]|nr:hypothetical protein [Verrucomicrobiae bacterium]